MITPRSNHRSAPGIGRAALVVALVVGLAACSAQGENEALVATADAPTTTSDVEEPTTTTTEADDPSPTTTTTGPDATPEWPAWVDTDELFELLPVTADLPDGYEEILNPAHFLGPADLELQRSFLAECPIATPFFPEEVPQGRSVHRHFAQPDGRRISVSFRPDVSPLASSDRAVEALNSCPIITEPWQGGGSVELAMWAEPRLGRPDGAVVTIHTEVEHPSLSSPVVLTQRIEVWSVDDVAVMVHTGDGSEQDSDGSATAVAMDVEWARDYAQGVAQLLDLLAGG